MSHYARFFNLPCPDQVYEILEQAFASYITPILFEKSAHLETWASGGLDWGLSVGIYENDELIGFILHGQGERGCLKNIVTALLPRYQGQGLLRALYPTLFGALRAKGFQRISLEVLTLNLRAVSCYSKIGFRITRRVEENSVLKFEMVKLI